jgi:hypothetical protein
MCCCCNKKLNRTLKRIERLLKRIAGAENPVGQLTATLISEENEMLIYNFALPQLPDPSNPGDTAKGLVRLSFGGVEQASVETTVGQVSLDGVRIPQGAVVTGSFVFVDDAANESAVPVVLTEFTASDTIPPPDATGTFSATLVGEE